MHDRVISINDTNPRSNKGLKESLARERKAANRTGFARPKVQRYGERTAVEQVYGRLKAEFRVRHLQVGGHKKSPSAIDVRCSCALCRSDNAVVDLGRLPNQLPPDCLHNVGYTVYGHAYSVGRLRQSARF